MSITERLYTIIVKVFKRMNKKSPPLLSEIRPESDLKADLGLDSLSFVLIMLEAEAEFQHDLPADKMSVCKTVADVVKIIESEINK